MKHSVMGWWHYRWRDCDLNLSTVLTALSIDHYAPKTIYITKALMPSRSAILVLVFYAFSEFS